MLSTYYLLFSPILSKSTNVVVKMTLPCSAVATHPAKGIKHQLIKKYNPTSELFRAVTTNIKKPEKNGVVKVYDLAYQKYKYVYQKYNMFLSNILYVLLNNCVLLRRQHEF